MHEYSLQNILDFIDKFPSDFCTAAVYDTTPWRVHAYQRSLANILQYSNRLSFDTLLTSKLHKEPVHATIAIAPPQPNKLYRVEVQVTLRVDKKNSIICIHDLYDWHECNNAYEYIINELIHGPIDVYNVMHPDYLLLLHKMYVNDPDINNFILPSNRRRDWMLNSYRTVVGRMSAKPSQTKYEYGKQEPLYETIEYVHAEEVLVKSLHYMHMQKLALRQGFIAALKDPETRGILGSHTNNLYDAKLKLLAAKNLFPYTAACKELVELTSERMYSIETGDLKSTFEPDKNAEFMKAVVSMSSTLRKVSSEIKATTAPYLRITKAIAKQIKKDAKKKIKKQK
jgi:hypothetical protein